MTASRPSLISQEEKYARLRLAAVPGVRADRLNALISSMGSAAEVLRRDAGTLAATGCFPLQTAERLIQTAKTFHPEEEAKIADSLGARLLFLEDPEIPDFLKSIPDPPLLLYCLGSLIKNVPPTGPASEPNDATNTLAIVGCRKPTPYGAKTARRLARESAEAGLVVVSGLARGIDTEAHRACLEAGGTTWAVLGSGLASIYPPENAPLARRIVEQGGAVVSEFPLQSPPLAEHFPRRNRIISGLSAGTLVVEGEATSGALITARLALEQGREVFAVPGPAESPMSRGPHLLLKEGAVLATSIEDVLEALPHMRRPAPKERPARAAPGASEEERDLLSQLEDSPLSIEELATGTRREVQSVSRSLLELEMRGLVVALGAQRYGLK